MAGQLNGMVVIGDEFVKEQLNGFLPKEVKAIARRTMPAIARIGRDDMRRRVPVGERILQRAVISKRDRGTRTTVEASIRITHGPGARYDAFYWHMVAYGTQKTQAQDFATPVYNTLKSNLPGLFQNQIVEQSLKQLEKRAKAQKK